MSLFHNPVRVIVETMTSYKPLYTLACNPLEPLTPLAAVDLINYMNVSPDNFVVIFLVKYLYWEYPGSLSSEDFIILSIERMWEKAIRGMRFRSPPFMISLGDC